MRVPTAPHPCQHLSLSVFWVLAIPKVCSGITYHIVLICMSLMTYEVEHNFICLFTSCISLLVRYLLRSLLHFLSGLFVFLFLSFKSLLYTLENSSLSDVSFASIFSQSMACLLFLLLSYYLTNSLKIYPEMGLLDYMEILYVLFEIYLLNIILHFNLFSIAYTYSYFPITACITYCS